MIKKLIAYCRTAVLTILLMCVSFGLFANEVEIISAEFQQDNDGSWTITVALLHADNGWEHYADKWQVVDTEGTVLAERVLLHPHDNEQPFSRSTYGVAIPDDTDMLYIQAHDSQHGWTDEWLEVDFTRVENGLLQIGRPDDR